MVNNLKIARFFKKVSTIKKIVILFIIIIVIFGGLSPTINSVIIKNNDINQKNSNKNQEIKKTGNEENVIAMAMFHYTPRYPDPGEMVTFYSDSYALNGHIYSEIWDLGNGFRKYGNFVTYTFNEKGKYRVTLYVKARGYNGGFDSDYKIITINVGGDPFPKILCTPESPLPGEEVRLDGTNSYDPDGNIISYNWSYYNIKNPENITYLGTERTVYCIWENQGIYNVILTILDDKGNNNSYEKAVHVSILKIEGFNKFSRNLNFKIINYGNISVNNVRWNLKVEKYPLSNFWTRAIYHDSGDINNIESGLSKNVRTKRLRRAFCKIKIDVTAEANNAVPVIKTLYGVTFGKNLFISEENIVNPYTIMAISSIIFTMIALFVYSIIG